MTLTPGNFLAAVLLASCLITGPLFGYIYLRAAAAWEREHDRLIADRDAVWDAYNARIPLVTEARLRDEAQVKVLESYEEGLWTLRD